VPTLPSAPPTSSLRERLVRAAVELTTEVGWSRVTMAVLADHVGVSRQTVYNEVGTKAGLAEAMIGHELERFLGVVNAAFDAHPDDLVAAIETASLDVLTVARGNRLLHAVVSATHGADTDLLPLLTTHSHSLLSVAKAVILERIPPYDVPLEGEHLEAAIDMVVRVVLSHVMQPTASPESTARDLAWIAARVLQA
jgi:AcrR family transcriptional regulator